MYEIPRQERTGSVPRTPVKHSEGTVLRVCGQSDEGRGFRSAEQGLQVRSQRQDLCTVRFGGMGRGLQGLCQ